MQVRNLMTESPATCQPNTGLGEVAKMMVDHDCGAIPVLEGDSSPKAAGIVTDRDIVARTVAQGNNPLDKKAGDAMTASTVTVSPNDSAEHCADLMEKNQLRRLVVVNDDDSIAGIDAQADLARRTSDAMTGEVVEEVSETV